MRFVRMDGIRLAFKFGSWKPTKQVCVLACFFTTDTDCHYTVSFKSVNLTYLLEFKLNAQLNSNMVYSLAAAVTQQPLQKYIIRLEREKCLIERDSSGSKDGLMDINPSGCFFFFFFKGVNKNLTG